MVLPDFSHQLITSMRFNHRSDADWCENVDLNDSLLIVAGGGHRSVHWLFHLVVLLLLHVYSAHLRVFDCHIFAAKDLQQSLCVEQQICSHLHFSQYCDFSLFQSQIFFLSLLLNRVHDQLDCCFAVLSLVSSALFSFVLFLISFHVSVWKPLRWSRFGLFTLWMSPVLLNRFI